MASHVLAVEAQDCAKSLLERIDMLLATPENMKKCKDIPGVVSLDLETGDAFSADAGDYWNYPSSEPIYGESCMVLAIKVCRWVDPISREELGV